MPILTRQPSRFWMAALRYPPIAVGNPHPGFEGCRSSHPSPPLPNKQLCDNASGPSHLDYIHSKEVRMLSPRFVKAVVTAGVSKTEIACDWIDDVMDYLVARGLGAQREEHRQLLRRILELQAQQCKQRL